MIIVNDAYCPQNHRCPSLRVCPTGALQQDGFNAPTVDQELCIDCGKCTARCPVFTQVDDGAPVGGPSGKNGKNGAHVEADQVSNLLQWFRREAKSR